MGTVTSPWKGSSHNKISDGFNSPIALCALGSKGIQRKLSGQAGTDRCRALVDSTGYACPGTDVEFALDRVVVTVDGWDHHFGLVVFVLLAFFKAGAGYDDAVTDVFYRKKSSFGDTI
ncbi:hypothetical protein [Microbulbifer sp. TRSA007]|uniref:hypothetical protein n=1 Tax=Microbulbifer sp. TRSA007 TaxID=3243384 RepID=UPI004039C654